MNQPEADREKLPVTEFYITLGGGHRVGIIQSLIDLHQNKNILRLFNHPLGNVLTEFIIDKDSSASDPYLIFRETTDELKIPVRFIKILFKAGPYELLSDIDFEKQSQEAQILYNCRYNLADLMRQELAQIPSTLYVITEILRDDLDNLDILANYKQAPFIETEEFPAVVDDLSFLEDIVDTSKQPKELEENHILALRLLQRAIKTLAPYELIKDDMENIEGPQTRGETPTVLKTGGYWDIVVESVNFIIDSSYEAAEVLRLLTQHPEFINPDKQKLLDFLDKNFGLSEE